MDRLHDMKESYLFIFRFDWQDHWNCKGIEKGCGGRGLLSLN